ncbi:hypothetical protein NSP_20960 [Nodularia spumigena CCY9414]|nr:hypothetical protein NSP_20960 [Nodularia spumigena CCY9414]
MLITAREGLGWAEEQVVACLSLNICSFSRWTGKFTSFSLLVKQSRSKHQPQG